MTPDPKETGQLVGVGQNADLDKWLTFLDGISCKCQYAWRSMGRLHGIGMGKGWVRITTHPNCPEHGIEAEAARRARMKKARN